MLKVNEYLELLSEARILEPKYKEGDKFTISKDWNPRGLNYSFRKGDSIEIVKYDKNAPVVGNGEMMKTIKLPDGSTRTLRGNSSTYSSNFKVLGSSVGGNKKPPADQYEVGICVEYNKLQGMSSDDAKKIAKVDIKNYEKYEDQLTEVCSKIAKNLPNLGSHLIHSGKDIQKPSTSWPSKDPTPKTDLYSSSDHRISLKKVGGSQLSSSKSGDAIGLFDSGVKYYETYSSNKATGELLNVVKKIEENFVSYNTNNDVSTVRKSAGDAYLKWRIPQIASKTRAKNKDIEKHARAEAIAAGIIGQTRSWEKNFLPDVDILSEQEIMKWFESYWKSLGTDELKNEAKDIVSAAINHKKLDTQLKNLFENDEFKKWVVYEASTGTYKFTGDIDLETSNYAVANYIMTFDLSGNADMKKITPKWAKQYASNVRPDVNFKSSGRQKYTALRLMLESNIQDELDTILKEETENLNTFISESVEYYGQLLNEWTIKGSIDKMKKFASKLMSNIFNKIKDFYKNVAKKVLNKIKEYISVGVNGFLEFLGIEVNGQAELRIDF